MSQPDQPAAAVLISGGLDSAILCVELLARLPPGACRSTSGRDCGGRTRSSPRWSASSPRSGTTGSIAWCVLDEPIADVYGAHWSTSGAGVPGSETADEAVYLPGRNLLLTVKAAVWCRLRGVRTLALGSLGSNPFPDSTPEFFRKLEGLLEPGDGRRPAADPAVRDACTRPRSCARQRPAAAPDVLLHRPARRPPLRPLQQVRGAEEGIPRRRDERPDALLRRALTAAIRLGRRRGYHAES